MAIGVTVYMGILIPEKDRGKEHFTPDWFNGTVRTSVSASEQTCNDRMRGLGHREEEYFVTSGPMVLKGRMV